MEEQRRRRQAEGFIAIATGVQPEMECAKSIAKLLGNYWRPGMTIADIGCGVGHYQRTFRRVLAPDLSYVGVDKSPIHIAAARRTYPDAQFIQADINNLPFEDDAFPIVICTSVITALPPPPGSALSELIRIAGHVLVVRMLFGVINYVVRCYPERPPDNMDPTEMFAHKEIFTYRNIYTETYVRTLIEEAYPSASVEIRCSDASGLSSDAVSAWPSWSSRTG